MTLQKLDTHTILENKVSIVTGAASGIGRGIAYTYAKAGANVVIADLDLDNAKIVAEELTQMSGKKAIAIKLDVTNESDVKACVAATVMEFGTVDILVSNAGIQTICPIVDFPFDKWKKLIEIHLYGTFLLSKECMNVMKKSKRGGSIIVMGSVHSFESSAEKSAYVAAKHALHGFVKSIAKEGAVDNIRANLIAPGFVKTLLCEKQIPEQAKLLGISEEDVVKKVMLGNTVDAEFTTIEDISHVALFFAGFRSNALTGQSLVVSHGWHMQ